MTTNWRALYAAGLYALGVPAANIGEALTDFCGTLTRERVRQLIAETGVTQGTIRRDERAARDAAINAAIDAARRDGMVVRREIVARVVAETGHPEYVVQAVAAARWGDIRYIPLPGTPPDHRWCGYGRHFVPVAEWYQSTHTCRACNTIRRRAQWRAQRAAMEEATRA